MKTVDYQRTGLAIYKMIENAGYSIPKAAELLGLSGNAVLYRWCSGQCLPKVEALFRLCELCNCTAEDLIITCEV